MNLFSVELKNQPGELAHLGDVCAPRGVNVQLAGVVTGKGATIPFSASDEAAVRTALEGAGLEFIERPALHVNCADLRRRTATDVELPWGGSRLIIGTGGPRLVADHVRRGGGGCAPKR